MNIQTIGVVGSGQMGRGIAQVAAFSGFDVVMYDLSKESLDFGMDFIKNQLVRGVKKEKWDQAKADETFGKIQPSSKIESMAKCDLIIEAATENKNIKFKIFHLLRGIN